MQALWYEPCDPAILARVLAATDADPDARTLWSHALLAAASDARGQYRPPRDVKDTLATDVPFLDRITIARAAAVAELAELATKARRSAGPRTPGNPLICRFARSLAYDVARNAPPLLAEHGGPLDAACAPRPDAYVPIVNALKKLITDALASEQTGLAIETARCLHGLAAQSDFKDLKGPEAPDLSVLREQAADSLRRARERLAPAIGVPLTVEQLEAMGLDEQLRFTREHASFANPGVAVSPSGLYRIETVCGYLTLLNATRTIERHHARLVSLYGTDPFLGRPGLVRIVPEAEGLEAEGSPYWWAGGFQSGDLTVLRFNASHIASLGRGLTHKLTHRFDGAVYGGLPGWLAEGKAVWTGSAYGQMIETSFIPNHCEYGTIEATMLKGYGGQDKLEDLVAGTVEDYRDNYVAGYALYVYLSSWEENGKRLYADALRRFQEQYASKGRNPKGWFQTCFCDGADGRPKGMKEFAGRFAEFINGFYWLNRKPWVDRYTEKRVEEAPANHRLLFDYPTWQFSRNRAEPWFGQGQAAIAGDLLARVGNRHDAALAFVWGFEVDEWSTYRALRLADLLDKLGEERAAWVLRKETQVRVQRDDVPDAGRSPLLSSLPRLNTYLALLAEASEHHRDAGRPRTAAALAADHDHLADRLGLPRSPSRSAADAADAAALAPPFDAPPRYVGHLGWMEDELTGYEEHRTPNLWYDDGEGGVHIGREKPREKTGQLDRSAHQRDAFVRGREWLLPGRYRLRARIHFTTTFVRGGVMIGYTRRDRNVRFEFDAGDYMYSIGESEKAAELDSVGVSLHSMRDGESASFGQTVGGGVNFDHPSTSFELELVVDGPLVLAVVNGNVIGTYHTADGQPIEGFIGFAGSYGAYRVEAPTIERYDRAAALDVVDPRTIGLSLDADGPVHRRDLLNRPVRGIPLAPAGTIVVWVPGPTEEDEKGFENDEERRFEGRRRAHIAARSARSAHELLEKRQFNARLAMAIPRFLDAEDVAVVKAGLERHAPECVLLVHEKVRDLTQQEGEAVATEMPMILFVDPVGVLRAIGSYMPSTTTVPGELESWLQVFRGRIAFEATAEPDASR